MNRAIPSGLIVLVKNGVVLTDHSGFTGGKYGLKSLGAASERLRAVVFVQADFGTRPNAANDS